MQRSPERYLLYFILIGALGSMMLIYGVSAYRTQPKIAFGALFISFVMLVLGIGIVVQRYDKRRRKSED